MTNLAFLGGNPKNSNNSSNLGEVPACSGASLSVVPFSWQFSVGGWTSLGLSNVVNSHNATNNNPKYKPERADRGQNGITSYGRSQVRASASFLEWRYNKNTLTFGTVTFPKLSPSDLALCNRSWHELVRKFNQEVRRLLVRRGLPPILVHVSEIQEERLHNYGECAMHLHYLHPGRKPGKTWAIRCDEIRMIWCRILENFLGHPIPDGCVAATRIERVRCSAAQYLGKYMSKGVKSLKEAKQMGFSDQLPSAWWGMSNALKSLISDFSCKLNATKAYFLIDNLYALQDMGVIKWFLPVTRSVEVGNESHEVCMGYVGQLTGEAAFEFLRGNISEIEFLSGYHFEDVA